MCPSAGKLSAFVVSYNRAAIIGTCLRGLRFADELIVVDKSSTDATPRIAAGIADRVITVPWSPTVEDTRAFAAAQCSHEWILFLDDDECLSPEAAEFVRRERGLPQADAYAFPLRHYILGEHDERAYYWPEHHVRWFRRGALSFGRTVHAGMTLHTDRVMQVAPDRGVCIHHLSHQDTAQWIDKANRYTSRPDRVRSAHAGEDLFAFAGERLRHWSDRTRDAAPGGYPAAVALLRTLYDLIDRLKVWEEEHGLDGAARFQAVCAMLDAGYAAVPVRTDAVIQAAVPDAGALPDAAEALRQSLQAARAEHDRIAVQLSTARDAAERQARDAVARADAAESRAAALQAMHQAALLRAEQAECALRMMRQSTFWRATSWPRAAVERLRSRR
ncbi:MAG TPA: glycosyltransferase [Acetobacteraceae bacterium]|nr:glycosyltransferase [Acetobacteraceae bacterium]